jgi:hypothetical protein
MADVVFAPFYPHVVDIVLSGSDEEVARIDAGGHITVVANEHSFRDWAAVELVADAMGSPPGYLPHIGSESGHADINLAVSLFVFLSFPQPAGVWIGVVHPTEKLLFKGELIDWNWHAGHLITAGLAKQDNRTGYPQGTPAGNRAMRMGLLLEIFDRFSIRPHKACQIQFGSPTNPSMVLSESTRRTWFKSLLGLLLVKKPVCTVAQDGVRSMVIKRVEMDWLEQPGYCEDLIRSNGGYWMT